MCDGGQVQLSGDVHYQVHDHVTFVDDAAAAVCRIRRVFQPLWDFILGDAARSELCHFVILKLSERKC